MIAVTPVPTGQRTSTSRPKFASLQAGRAIAALLVVFHHTCTFTGDATLWHRAGIARFTTGFALGVAFFFVLSGIVILSAHWGDLGKPSSAPSYLWKRFRRIYPIYWLILLPVLAGQFISPHAEFPYQRHPFVILSSFLLVHIVSSQTNLAVAWTLFHEVCFYVIFATVLLHRRIGTVVLALWLGLSLLRLSPSADPQSAFFSPLHLLFAMGLFAAWLLKSNAVGRSRQLLAVRAPLFLSLGTLTFCLVLVWAARVGALSQEMYLAAGLGSMLALVGAASLERHGGFAVPAWLVFLGDASYSIYLIHFPVVSHLSRLCFRLDTHLHLPIGFWMVLVATIGTACGCLLHVFVERPLLKWMGTFGVPAARTG